MTHATDLLSIPQTAALLGVKRATLDAWRCRGTGGPAFVKVGRLVKYQRKSLEAYIEARTKQPPSRLVGKAATILGGA